ncbi:MAG: excinuclease ABC subunit UvrC [Bacteroidales bacterium]|jgi:excinuclease ABC subunit C|nr:excinuclease ABC subunit UvrC [Bacteroidales bacterium]
MIIDSKLESSVKNLPESPGIYKYLDKAGKIIYVGKAKNLKKRVAQYFNKTQQSDKTQLLVKNICEIEFVVVDTEGDALLLENNLIKKLQPKYNIMLKDDKTYPWICIKKENFPRIFSTRQKINDGSEYFGPFPSIYIMKTLLGLIKTLFPLRRCANILSEQNISKGKNKVCLEYHIGNCLAPCIKNIDEDTYNDFISQSRKIIIGDLQTINEHFKNKMLNCAKEYKFEEAAKIKEKLEIIEKYTGKTVIVNKTITNIEVFGFSKDIDSAYISYLQIKNGAIINTYNLELKKKIEESDEDMLLYAVLEIKEIMNDFSPRENKSNIKNIILPFPVDYQLKNMIFEYPKRGEKFDLLKLAEKNAKFFMLDRHKQIESKNPEISYIRKLETLQKDLHLAQLPVHIECFDNSNIQGTNPVASCVVFKNAKPSKKNYRHFNIKTVEGPDDFASMSEIIFRRYQRILDENGELPNLIIVDGGKGQLNAAIESLKQLNLFEKIPIIGIAKRLEEIFFPNDNIPLYLNKNSESLKIIQQARDEAHRFGITFHRNKRSKSFITSELQNIKGIGEKTMELLLDNFKTVEKIKSLSVEELSIVVDKRKAEIVYKYFDTNK